MRDIQRVAVILLFLMAGLAIATAPALGQISGAVFTTDKDGETNVNLYPNKMQVHLNGGPIHEGAAGLPDGPYHAKVTEPNGTLLGISNPAAPPILVVGGEFVQPYKLWNIVYKASDGTQGYDDTGNGGGEYKVWVSQNPAFPNPESKTDNFKVKNGKPIPQTEIVVTKFYDADGDGVWDDGEPPIPNWHVDLYMIIDEGPPLVVELVGCQLTDAGGAAKFLVEADGTAYLVAERIDVETLPGAEYVNTTPIEVPVIASGESVEVEFGNVCVAYADFDTKGYWHNKNGLTELTEEDSNYVNLLEPYDDPTTYFGDGDEPFDGYFTDGTPVDAAFNNDGEEVWGEGTWQAEVSQFLVDPNAGGDPREQLAQQLLAFIFNTRHRLGSPDATIQLPDGSWAAASDLIDEAIAAWLSDDADWQNEIAGKLDSLNNNDAVRVLSPDPCPFVPIPPCL